MDHWQKDCPRSNGDNSYKRLGPPRRPPPQQAQAPMTEQATGSKSGKAPARVYAITSMVLDARLEDERNVQNFHISIPRTCSFFSIRIWPNIFCF